MEEKKKKQPELTQEELMLIQQVLYQSRWNGQQWEKAIKPLINKLAKMTDEQKTSE